MTTCIRCIVSGKVQGVWFRGSTQQQAVALGITGYARNLADGTVEVLACGQPHALDELKRWLRQGPKLARVEQVTCEPVSDVTGPGAFATD